MKKCKILLCCLLSVLCLTLFACENATALRVASISEITSAGSKNYGVRITYQQDKRVEEKATDVQIKFNKLGKVVFWEENQEKDNI